MVTVRSLPGGWLSSDLCQNVKFIRGPDTYRFQRFFWEFYPKILKICLRHCRKEPFSLRRDPCPPTDRICYLFLPPETLYIITNRATAWHSRRFVGSTPIPPLPAPTDGPAQDPIGKSHEWSYNGSSEDGPPSRENLEFSRKTDYSNEILIKFNWNETRIFRRNLIKLL